MPVLTPGSTPLRVLHLSDIHMRPTQRHKQAWLRELARWEPDLVVNTGDNLSHPKAVPAVVQSIGDLMSFPGVFVFGSNIIINQISNTHSVYNLDANAIIDLKNAGVSEKVITYMMNTGVNVVASQAPPPPQTDVVVASPGP